MFRVEIKFNLRKVYVSFIFKVAVKVIYSIFCTFVGRGYRFWIKSLVGGYFYFHYHNNFI